MQLFLSLRKDTKKNAEKFAEERKKKKKKRKKEKKRNSNNWRVKRGGKKRHSSIKEVTNQVTRVVG
jgi:hypothetical protein